MNRVILMLAVAACCLLMWPLWSFATPSKTAVQAKPTPVPAVTAPTVAAAVVTPTAACSCGPGTVCKVTRSEVSALVSALTWECVPDRCSEAAVENCAREAKCCAPESGACVQCDCPPTVCPKELPHETCGCRVEKRSCGLFGRSTARAILVPCQGNVLNTCDILVCPPGRVCALTDGAGPGVSHTERCVCANFAAEPPNCLCTEPHSRCVVESPQPSALCGEVRAVCEPCPAPRDPCAGQCVGNNQSCTFEILPSGLASSCPLHRMTGCACLTPPLTCDEQSCPGTTCNTVLKDPDNPCDDEIVCGECPYVEQLPIPLCRCREGERCIIERVREDLVRHRCGEVRALCVPNAPNDKACSNNAECETGKFCSVLAEGVSPGMQARRCLACPELSDPCALGPCPVGQDCHVQRGEPDAVTACPRKTFTCSCPESRPGDRCSPDICPKGTACREEFDAGGCPVGRVCEPCPGFHANQNPCTIDNGGCSAHEQCTATLTTGDVCPSYRVSCACPVTEESRSAAHCSDAPSPCAVGARCIPLPDDANPCTPDSVQCIPCSSSPLRDRNGNGLFPEGGDHPCAATHNLCPMAGTRCEAGAPVEDAPGMCGSWTAHCVCTIPPRPRPVCAPGQRLICQPTHFGTCPVTERCHCS